MTDAPAIAGCGTRSSAAFYADALDAFLRAAHEPAWLHARHSEGDLARATLCVAIAAADPAGLDHESGM